jgi:predicted nucleotidyltransferase
MAYTEGMEADLLDPVLQAERSPLAPPALEAVTAALDRPGVIRAWAYGSQLQGGAGRLSDLDIAVELEPDALTFSKQMQRELQGAAARELRAVGVEVSVDVSIVNDTLAHWLPTELQRAGTLLVDRSEADSRAAA